ncbi:hypothetical protein D9M68_806610 [compost metagenome]
MSSRPTRAPRCTAKLQPLGLLICALINTLPRSYTPMWHDCSALRVKSSMMGNAWLIRRLSGGCIWASANSLRLRA